MLQGWSHPASLCQSSPPPCLPTPGKQEQRDDGDQVSCSVSTSTSRPYDSRAGFRLHNLSPGTAYSLIQSLLFSYHGNHWTRAHVADEDRKEGSFLQVSVVLLQEVVRGLQQGHNIGRCHCTSPVYIILQLPMFHYRKHLCYSFSHVHSLLSVAPLRKKRLLFFNAAFIHQQCLSFILD